MHNIKICVLAFSLLLTNFTFAQNVFQTYVKDEKTHEPLIGANIIVDSLNIGGTTDIYGRAKVTGIPNGTHVFSFSYLGYETKKIHFTFMSYRSERVDTVFLTPKELSAEIVIITATRNNGIVEDSPIRVEVLGQEEVNEEISIRPGNISKLLSETSGIFVQQTSAVSGNVSFRLQGLSGTYTQLLKDGLPIYGGASSGLSLLQIPPLDLRQVEVMKGSLSTLYGNGAIAGIINLVSKEPAPGGEFSLVLNQTNKKGRDISAFYSNRQDKVGLTFLASQSIQDAVDVNSDGLTDIPDFRQITLNPKLFVYFDPSMSLNFGISSFFENRQGGDIIAIEKGRDSNHSFIVTNTSTRLTSQLRFQKQFNNNNVLTVKNSISYFKNDLAYSKSLFSGIQISSYSEASYLMNTDKHKVVLGGSYVIDTFEQQKDSGSKPFDYSYSTIGLFAQDDWTLNPDWIIQTGMRIDYNNIYNTFVLPHLSILYKITDNLQARVSAGLGYHTPVFADAISEEEIFRENLLEPIEFNAENSKGFTIDLNYKFTLDEFVLTFNPAFFLTSVKGAVIPMSPRSNQFNGLIFNSNTLVETQGFDIHSICALDELCLFVDWTHTTATKTIENNKSPLELTPEDKLNMTLTFELERDWRTGLEAFYTGKQYLDNQVRSPDFWTLGIMVEKIFDNFSIVFNVENIFDVRQTNYESVFNSPITNPGFKPVYAPLDGIVANIALKINIK